MAKHRPLLAVCEVGEIYSFISYRRSDWTRIAPILSGLKLAGFPFWFDHGIPGGADWLSELQERLRRARALVLFLGRAAGESRYVRLEASYAFSLGKPILPVRLEEVELKGLPAGLGLLLNSIQTIDFHVEEIIRHLRQHGL